MDSASIPRRGRPPVGDESRTVKVTLLLTPSEAAKVEELRQEGETRSSCLRRLILSSL